MLISAPGTLAKDTKTRNFYKRKKYKRKFNISKRYKKYIPPAPTISKVRQENKIKLQENIEAHQLGVCSVVYGLNSLITCSFLITKYITC
jgi:hypothetical protein